MQRYGQGWLEDNPATQGDESSVRALFSRNAGGASLLGGPTGYAVPLTFPAYDPKEACDSVGSGDWGEEATGLLEKLQEVAGALLDVGWDPLTIPWSDVCNMALTFNKLWGYRVYVLREADYKTYVEGQFTDFASWRARWRAAAEALMKAGRPVIFDFPARYGDTQNPGRPFQAITRGVAALPVDPADAARTTDKDAHGQTLWKAGYRFLVHPLFASRESGDVASWVPFSLTVGTYGGDYRVGYVADWRREQFSPELSWRAEQAAREAGGDGLYQSARDACESGSSLVGCNWYVSHGPQGPGTDGHGEYYPPAPDERLEVAGAALEGTIEISWREEDIPSCQRQGGCVTVKATVPATVERLQPGYVCGTDEWCGKAGEPASVLGPVSIVFTEPVEVNPNAPSYGVPPLPARVILNRLSDSATGDPGENNIPVDVWVHGDTLTVTPRSPLRPGKKHWLVVQPSYLRSQAPHSGSYWPNQPLVFEFSTRPNLEVEVAGAGLVESLTAGQPDGRIRCGWDKFRQRQEDCAAVYEPEGGQPPQVTLRAEPRHGFTFGWWEDCGPAAGGGGGGGGGPRIQGAAGSAQGAASVLGTGQTGTLTLTITGYACRRAVFTAMPTLTVALPNPRGGLVESVEIRGPDGRPETRPAGEKIRCGFLGSSALPGGGQAVSYAGQCREYFLRGSRVRLRVTAAPGFAFAGWAGEATGAQTEVWVTVDGDRAVEARFRIYRPCPAGSR